jgi:hypothetical protein
MTLKGSRLSFALPRNFANFVVHKIGWGRRLRQFLHGKNSFQRSLRFRCSSAAHAGMANIWVILGFYLGQEKLLIKYDVSKRQG